LVGYVPQLLLHAYVPLIKLEVRTPASASPTQVEISWNDELGIYKTSLLAEYSKVHPHVRPLILLIKHWSKMRNISNTRQGGLGSYAWCLLSLYFLMKIAKPPVIPNLQALAREKVYNRGHDVSFLSGAQFSRENGQVSSQSSPVDGRVSVR